MPESTVGGLKKNDREQHEKKIRYLKKFSLYKMQIDQIPPDVFTSGVLFFQRLIVWVTEKFSVFF